MCFCLDDVHTRNKDNGWNGGIMHGAGNEAEPFYVEARWTTWIEAAAPTRNHVPEPVSGAHTKTPYRYKPLPACATRRCTTTTGLAPLLQKHPKVHFTAGFVRGIGTMQCKAEDVVDTTIDLYRIVVVMTSKITNLPPSFLTRVVHRRAIKSTPSPSPMTCRYQGDVCSKGKGSTAIELISWG